MQKPTIYADIHYTLADGRVRLDCDATLEALGEQDLELHEGMDLTLRWNELDQTGWLRESLVDGVVSFSEQEQCWVAAVDRSTVRASVNEKAECPTNGAKPEDETSDYWDPESTSRMTDRMERGCVFVVCLFAVVAGLFIGLHLGFPCWVVQQVLVLGLAFDLFPAQNRIPGIGYIHYGFETLFDYYRRNPRFRRPVAIIARMIPFLAWAVMIQEWRVMAWIVFVGLPIDLTLQILTTYVWPVPTWGFAGSVWMDFLPSVAIQTMMTFVYTPHLVLFVMVVKWNKRRRSAQRDSGSENPSTM
jgi:hypothetical protein